jgi:hypothetical protein
VVDSSIGFQIKEVFPGKYNDSCISGIRFLHKGRPLKFENLEEFLKKQSELSLSMALKAKKSDADYFKYMYTQHGSGFSDPASKLIYYFHGDNYRIVKNKSLRQQEFQQGQYSISGNFIFFYADRSHNSYLEIPLKLHFKPAGPNALYINENKCQRFDRDWNFQYSSD